MITLYTIFGIFCIAILMLIINSLFIIGLYSATNEDKVLVPIKKILEKTLLGKYKMLELIYDGLIGCLECMSSFWGTFFVIIVLSCLDIDVFQWICSKKILLLPIYTLSLSQIVNPIKSAIDSAIFHHN